MDFLELELERAVSQKVGAGNEAQVLCKRRAILEPLSHLAKPHSLFLLMNHTYIGCVRHAKTIL